MAMRPAVGSSTPRIMLIVVVLPAPLGPRSPTISPADTWKDTSSTAFSVPKDLARRSTARTGGEGGLIGRSYQTGPRRRQAAPPRPALEPVAPPAEPPARRGRGGQAFDPCRAGIPAFPRFRRFAGGPCRESR